MAKLGGGVVGLKVNLLLGLPPGLHQQGLAEGEHSLLGPTTQPFSTTKSLVTSL